MFKPVALALSIPLLTQIEKFEVPEQKFEIKGDYTFEAFKDMQKRNPNKVKDVNDIMYEIIIKEMESGIHD